MSTLWPSVPASRLPASRRHLAIVGVVLVTAVAYGPRTGARDDLRRRSQQLTQWVYDGALESLPGGAILDLGGPGDTVLVRWFRDRRRESPGREWPGAPLLTLEGPDAAQTVRARFDASYGRELEVLDEGVYPCYHPLCERPYSFEYNRIVQFSERPEHLFTVAWLWVRDSLVGGWVIPSRRATPSDLAAYEPKTTLRLPFGGAWVVLWGGPKPHENYHVEVPPLRFATDFVVDSGGSLHRTDGLSNADYYCFGRPVLAPAAGRVLMALDSFPENVPGRSPPGYRGPGNFVAIDHRGEVSVLAHLRRGSVRVKGGQEVQAGDTVGECGNNGQSLLPHLHYQLQLSPRPGERPVPAKFSDYVADGAPVESGTPTRGQHVANAARRQ